MSLRKVALASGIAMVLGLMGGCASAGGGADNGSQDELTDLRYMVPNAPGSGWDTTARTAARALEDSGIVTSTEVFNVDGANGTVGLARLANEAGNGELTMQMGLGLVGSVVTLKSDVTLEDVTPVAKLVEDLEVVFVSADSPYESIEDLAEAWEEDPSALTIGGGSSPGGADHLVPMLIGKELGLKPTDVAYNSLGGSGVMPAVLGGQVDFAVTGAGDVMEQAKAGKVRALAVSGEERLEGIPDVPTLEESGIAVTLTNWRGVVAPPDLTDEEVAKLTEAFDKLNDSQEWKDLIEQNGWVQSYSSGEEFAKMIGDQDAEVRSILNDLGLS